MATKKKLNFGQRMAATRAAKKGGKTPTMPMSPMMKKKGKKVDAEDRAEIKAGKKPSAAEERAESKKGKKKAGAAIKKTGTFDGKSNALGHGGRAAQMKAQGVPGYVIGKIAREEQAAPGQKNYHGKRAKKKAQKTYLKRVGMKGK